MKDLETAGKGEVSHRKIAEIPVNLPLQLVNLQQGSQELLVSSPLPPHRPAPLMVLCTPLATGKC